MAGPWEQYQQAAPEPESGPWEQFAPPEPDLSAARNYIKGNLAQYKASQVEAPPAAGVEQKPQDPTPKPQPRHGEGFLDALEAGWQMSTSGLISRGKMPDTVLPEDAGMAAHIAFQAGQTVGDLPAMVGGVTVGTMGGGPLAPLTGMAGAWAAPAGIRKLYIDQLQKGDVKDFGDFFQRAAGLTWDMTKAAITGAATAAAGAPYVSGIAKTAAELAAMTTVGKAMDGQIPKLQDFAEGAVILGGMHGISAIAGGVPSAAKDVQTKLFNIYKDTGMKPSEVVQEAAKSPILRQEMVEQGTDTPASLKPLSTGEQPGQPAEKPARVEATLPKEESLPGLNSEFQVSKAREVIESKIGQPPKEPEKQTFDSLYARTIDSLDPLAKWRDAVTGDAELPKGEDPYAVVGKAQSQAYGRAHAAVETGPIDIATGKPTGEPGLRQILEPFTKPDDLQGFKNYAIAKRTLEIQERGVTTVVPGEAAKQYVEENAGKFEKSFRQFVDWQNSGLKDLRDSGIISKDAHDQILKENKDYTPLNAYVENKEPGSARNSIAPLKAVTGNEKYLLVDPLESAIRNRYAYSKLAEENLAKQSIVELAKKYDAPSELLEKVPQTSRPTTATDQEVEKFFKDNGIEWEGGEAPTLQLWRAQSSPLAKDQMLVMDNGKPSTYKLDESVAKAFQATGSTEPTPMLLKITNAIAKVQRAGITLDPFFLLKHAIRDQFSASIYSENGYRFAWDGLRGLGHIFADSSKWNEFLANGGGMTTLADFDKEYIQKDIWGLSRETGMMDRVQNVVQTPFERMESFARMVFTAPKMGEYLRAIEAGKDIPTSIDDARNVTPNVQRVGSSALVKAWSQATPFASMRMRGMDQMVKSFQDDPYGTATRMALAITLPSVATWWAFKDDPRYANAARWEKDLFWVIPIGDPKTGTTLRIPKPFEPGLLFGSLAERALQAHYKEDPDAFKGFGEALVGDALPNVIPAAIMPALEQFANRSWLTGGKIVPDSMEHVAPASVYSPYTSDTAKTLGKMIQHVPLIRDVGPGNRTLADPMVIDNFVREWTGTLGQYALSVADKGLQAAGVTPTPVKPATTLADIPFVRSFIARYPSMGAQPIQDFYDNLEASRQNYETPRSLVKRGDIQAAQDYRSASGVFPKLDGIAKAISAQSAVIQKIYLNTDMTPNDKRQQIDGLYYTIIQEATMANHSFNDAKKARAP